MSTAVDRILEQRARRIGRRQYTQSLASAVALHALVIASAILLPRLTKTEVPKIEAVAVTVVPPRALGEESPTPPRRDRAADKKPVTAPAPPPTPEPQKKTPPPPEPPKDRAAKLPEPTPPARQPEKNTEKNPPKDPNPAPSNAEPTPGNELIKRQGSPFGNPLGASTQRATLGVEDPNFTYGYYLDRVVGLISNNWTRPPVGAEVKQALIYFRIGNGGVIREIKLVETSGSEEFDQAALRAVEASSPLPPLPKSYNKEHLGIHLIVK